jgi:hypothetical protein
VDQPLTLLVRDLEVDPGWRERTVVIPAARHLIGELDDHAVTLSFTPGFRAGAIA